MNSKHRAMRAEAMVDILERLESNYSGYYCDLQDKVFNVGYYVIGSYQAKEVLREYDVFDAINLVQEYEKDCFGTILTNLGDPEKIINMVYYIIGEEVINEMYQSIPSFNHNYNNIADDETNQDIIAGMKELFEEELN